MKKFKLKHELKRKEKLLEYYYSDEHCPIGYKPSYKEDLRKDIEELMEQIKKLE